MCGNNNNCVDSVCFDRNLRTGLQEEDVNSVVVSVEHESPSFFVHRLLEEGNHVAMKLEDMSPPPWFNADKFKRGQQFFWKNYYIMFVSKLCGLVLVLSVPTILKILILTGKSSTPPKAFKRYMETISNMLDWYSGDLKADNSNVHKVLVNVRGKHCAAARKAVANGIGFISQKDLVLTQFGFMGIILTKRKFLGVRGCEDDIEGFIHFWRTIGYYMGIEDRFNLCGGNVHQTTEICRYISDIVFKTLITNASEEFDQMSRALITGMKPVVPLLQYDSFFELVRQFVGLESKRLDSCVDRILLSYLKSIHTALLSIWYLAIFFRPIFNGLLRFSIFCNITFPLVAFLTWGKEVWKTSTTNEHTNKIIESH